MRMWTLDSSKCTSCGACVKACPFQVLEMQDGLPRIKDGQESVCNVCADPCADTCPEQAIELTMDRPAPSGASPDNI